MLDENLHLVAVHAEHLAPHFVGFALLQRCSSEKRGEERENRGISYVNAMLSLNI